MEKIKNELANWGYAICILYMTICTFMNNTVNVHYVTAALLVLIAIAHIFVSGKFKFEKVLIVVMVFVLCEFVVSFIRYDIPETRKYFEYFVLLCSSGFYFSDKEFNLDKTLNIVCILFSVYMLIGGGAASLQKDYFNFSHYMVPGVCSLVLLGLKYITSRKWFGFVYLGLAIYFAWMVLVQGSRSSVVSIVSFCVIILWFFVPKKWMRILDLSIGIIITYMIMNIGKALVFISDIFMKFGVNLLFVEKSLLKISGESGLTSGRLKLIGRMLSDDAVQLLVGRGISGSEAVYGTYPHNIIVNFLIDYGVIGLVFIVLIFVYTYMIMNRVDNDKKILITILFSSVIVPLFFSYTYWRYPAFFLYIGIVLTEKRRLGVKLINIIPAKLNRQR